MRDLRGRNGFEFSQKKREEAAQRDEGRRQEVPAKERKPTIEVVDNRATVLSLEEAREALQLVEDGYKGNTESEQDLN